MQCLMKERWIQWSWSRWEAGEVGNRYRRCCWDVKSVKETSLVMRSAWAFSTLQCAMPTGSMLTVAQCQPGKNNPKKKRKQKNPLSRQSKTSSPHPNIIFPEKRDHRSFRKPPWPRLASVCCRAYCSLSHPEKQREPTETQLVPPSHFLTYTFIKSKLIIEFCQTSSM